MPQRILTKPVAYVSDENYVALVGVQAEFESLETGQISLFQSSATGALYADVRRAVTASASPKRIWLEVGGVLNWKRRTLAAPPC